MRLMEGQRGETDRRSGRAPAPAGAQLKNIDEARQRHQISRDWGHGRDAGKIARTIGLNVPGSNAPAVCGKRQLTIRCRH